jgi:hypothetical protein
LSALLSYIRRRGFDRGVVGNNKMWLAAWAVRRERLGVVLAASSVLLAFFTAEFSRWVWIA